MGITTVPLVIHDRIMSFLSLADTARLSAAGKSLGKSISEALDSSRPFERLVQGLKGMYPDCKTFARDTKSPLHRLWAAVKLLQDRPGWGQAAAATPGLTVDLSALFSVPHTPSNIALHFAQHVGLHMSYQQLLAAARSRVAGIEVWVQAQQELNILTDIPYEALAVVWRLNGAPSVWEPLPPAKAADILHLAFNYDEQAADGATHLLSQLTDVSTLAELLRTAIQRRYTAAVRCVLQLPLAQGLQAQQIISVLGELIDRLAAAIQQDESWHHHELVVEVVQQLICSPEAANITTGNVLGLMQAALYKGAEDVVFHLCWEMEAARRMETSALVEMLQQAVKHKRNKALGALTQLPAARRISPEDIAELLMAVCRVNEPGGYVSLQQGPNQAICLLCRMQPEIGIPAQLLNRLVRTAVTTGTGGLGTMCSELQTVHNWFESGGQRLLVELMTLQQQYNPGNLLVAGEFFELPTAECIPGNITVTVLQAAMQQQDINMMSLICDSAASDQLDIPHVQDLLTVAEQVYGCHSSFVDTLRQLAATEGAPMAVVQEVLRSAVAQIASSDDNSDSL